MEKFGQVTLDQVERALQDLGGEATWSDILDQVTKNRGGDYSYYKDWGNYKTTTYQVIQRHCPDYKKYRGPARFEKTSRGRCRLVGTTVKKDSSISVKQRSAPIAMDIDIKENYGKFYADDKNNSLIQINDDLSVFELEHEHFEGEKKYRLSNYYERDPKLRVAAIKAHGMACIVCGFDFKEFYGEHGAGFIEVHHLTPINKLDTTTKVCPDTDMTVVCSNCHRMLHRSKDFTLTPLQLKAIIKK